MIRICCFAAPLLLSASHVAAQTTDEPPPDPVIAPSPPATGNSDQELAQKLANPVANLISVPFQNNFDCCFGPRDAERYTLNVQPVIPVSLGKADVIIRTIVPFISQGAAAPGSRGQTDFGDITQTFFFKPAKEGALTWGIGPAFLWPIGGSGFGSGKFGAGPSALALRQTKSGVTAGVLANHIWSYAGKDNRGSISSTFIQPFLVKNFRDTTSLGINTETTYDWINDHWTVPVNVTVGHVFKFGEQRVQLTVGARYYAESPPEGPRWGMRFVTTFLFPE